MPAGAEAVVVDWLRPMVFIDYNQHVINCKVVYFGPAGAGKTANIEWVWKKTKGPDDTSGQTERYYEYLPLRLGDIRGFKTQFHLYTVPGAPGAEEARRRLLENVDGLIFVADSRSERAADNAALLQELDRALQTWGFSLWKLPFVLQCNMSDAPSAVPSSGVASALLGTAADRVPVFASSAASGVGVFETLKAASRLVLQQIRK